MNTDAAEILGRLQRETGASLHAIDDHELIHELVNALAASMNADDSPACRAMLMPSLRVGNIVLYRLSHGAKLFFEREILPVWIKKREFCNLAYAWCMAHSKRPDLLWMVSGDAKEIKKSIKRWEKTIGVPSDVLIDGVEQILETVSSLYKPSEGGSKRKSDSLGPWIAELARETGRSVEDLMWRCPEEELLMLLTQRPTKPGESEAIDAESPYVVAVKRLRDAESAIREKLTERATNE